MEKSKKTKKAKTIVAVERATLYKIVREKKKMAQILE